MSECTDDDSQLEKQDLAKERLLRWKLQQSMKSKAPKMQSAPSIACTQDPVPIIQDLIASSEADPLDLYMETLQNQQHSTTPSIESIQPLEQEESIPISHFPAQDVIASAQKKPKSNPDQIPSLLQHHPDTTPFTKVFYKDPTNPKSPAAIERWEQAGLSTRVLSILQTLGFDRPTKIQAQAIPAILSGLDLIGIAKTGSGKTLAFVLPLIRHVIDQRHLGFGEGPIALILTPTRELALQIYDQLRIFLRGTSLRALACYGGPPIKDQIASLKRGAEIVVSTPGRMIDLLCANSGRVTNLRRTTFLVVDEADRMFDVGFEPQVLKICAATRPDRQTVLFSATFPRSIEGLAKKILDTENHIHIYASTAKEGRIPCSDIDQRIECLDEEEDKFPLLLQIIGQFHLAHGSTQKILVFVQRQESADCLLRDLLRKGYHCCSLHGGKDQSDRDCAISDFKSGMIPIMVATSVAARGLDVPDLDVVVNYDCPSHLEDYVHRVGRTGRAGRKGIAYTFLTPDQSRQAAQIERALVLGGLKEIPPALHALAQEAGNGAKKASLASGYGGKGLERLDSEREHFKSVQSHAFTGAEGANDEEEQQEQPMSHNIKPQPLSSLSRALHQAIEKINNRLRALGVRLEADIEHLPYDPVLALNTKLGYSSVEGSGQIIPIPEGASAAISPSGQRMGFCCEFMINDYPQPARWRVTNRDNLSAITMASGTAVTVRGTFVPPGKRLQGVGEGEGERKLFLYIEGPTREAVEGVREQIRQILTEGTCRCCPPTASYPNPTRRLSHYSQLLINTPTGLNSEMKIASLISCCLFIAVAAAVQVKRTPFIIFGCKEETILMRSLFYGAVWSAIEGLKARSERLLEAFFCKILPSLSSQESANLHALIVREQAFYKAQFRLFLKVFWKVFFLSHWRVHSSIFLQQCILGLFSVDGALGDLDELEFEVGNANANSNSIVLAGLFNQYGMFFLYLETLQQMIVEDKEVVVKNVRAVKHNLPKFYAKYVSYYHRKLKKNCSKAASISGSVVIFD